MSRYGSKSSNPFEDEDGDDFVFVPNQNQGRSPFDDRRQQLTRLANESEDRQLESTQRALASLYESEQMGNATAEVRNKVKISFHSTEEIRQSNLHSSIAQSENNYIR
jgi:DNA primase